MLRSVGTYIARYADEMSAVVFAEDYTQIVILATRGETDQRLRSDLLLLTDPLTGWTMFRDVMAVDGSPVRDHDARVAQLFTQPSADVRAEAQRIADESARFNLTDIGSVRLDRTINMPFVARPFLRRDNQSHSTFRIDRTETLQGERVQVLSFEKTAKPRLVRSRDDMAMHGMAWVAPDSGRVLRTRLAFTTTGPAATLSGTIQVDYAPDANLGILVPVSMEEHYIAGSGTMTGSAKYSNVRQFNVTEGETTRSPR